MLMLQSQAEAQDRYRIVVEQTGTAVFEMNYKTGDFSCSEAYHKYAGSLQLSGDAIQHRRPSARS